MRPLTFSSGSGPAPSAPGGARPPLGPAGIAAGAAALLAVAAGWLALAAMVTAVPPGGRGALGPLMDVFGEPGLPPELQAALAALCTSGPGAAPFSAAALGGAAAMWLAMTVAMMLPPVVPAFVRFADVDAAAGATGAVVRILAAAAGYGLVWAAFTALAALGQTALLAAGALTPALVPASTVLAGTTLLAAGLYQFTPLKQACLERCRRPAIPPLAARPRAALAAAASDAAAGLGSCAGPMAAMLALGLMNVVWMAILTLAIVAEKATRGQAVPRGIGLGLLAGGAATLTPLVTG